MARNLLIRPGQGHSASHLWNFDSCWKHAVPLFTPIIHLDYKDDVARHTDLADVATQLGFYAYPSSECEFPVLNHTRLELTICIGLLFALSYLAYVVLVRLSHSPQYDYVGSLRACIDPQFGDRRSACQVQSVRWSFPVFVYVLTNTVFATLLMKSTQLFVVVDFQLWNLADYHKDCLCYMVSLTQSETKNQ